MMSAITSSPIPYMGSKTTTLSAHTAGPWKIQGYDAGDHEAFLVTAQVQFAPPSPKTIGVTVADNMSVANARLIAAAPELLEACKVMERCKGNLPQELWNKYCKPAIDKAEGRA